MHDVRMRALWLAVSLLAATIIGAGTAGLYLVDSKGWVTAVVAGGSAFAATTVLALLILQFVAGAGRHDG